jgi:hypothetical protein
MTLGLKKISSFPLQLYCHCQQSTGCKNIIKVQLRPFLGRKLSWKIAAHSSEKVLFFSHFHESPFEWYIFIQSAFYVSLERPCHNFESLDFTLSGLESTYTSFLLTKWQGVQSTKWTHCFGVLTFLKANPDKTFWLKSLKKNSFIFLQVT